MTGLPRRCARARCAAMSRDERRACRHADPPLRRTARSSRCTSRRHLENSPASSCTSPQPPPSPAPALPQRPRPCSPSFASPPLQPAWPSASPLPTSTFRPLRAHDAHPLQLPLTAGAHQQPPPPRPLSRRSARDRVDPRSPRRRFNPRGRPPRRRRLRIFDHSVRTTFTFHQLPTAPASATRVFPAARLSRGRHVNLLLVLEAPRRPRTRRSCETTAS